MTICYDEHQVPIIVSFSENSPRPPTFQIIYFGDSKRREQIVQIYAGQQTADGRVIEDAQVRRINARTEEASAQDTLDFKVLMDIVESELGIKQKQPGTQAI